MKQPDAFPAPGPLVDRLLGAPPGSWSHAAVAAVPATAALLVGPWWVAGIVLIGTTVAVTALAKRWPRLLLRQGRAERAVAVARWRGSGRKLQEVRAAAVIDEAMALCALGRSDEAAARALHVMGSIGRGLAQQSRRLQLGEMMARHGCWQSCADMLASLPDDAWYDGLRPTRDGNLAAALIALDDPERAVDLLDPRRLAQADGAAAAMLANNRALALLLLDPADTRLDLDEVLALARRARAGLPSSPVTAATLGAALLRHDEPAALALLEEAHGFREAGALWQAWVALNLGAALIHEGQLDAARGPLGEALAQGTPRVQDQARALLDGGTAHAVLRSGTTRIGAP
ncbi:MAG: hypothetical protein H6742_08610 [Alphaproteobacteria bacterium]|nr:hypothetical protein [Alphaproteobacteria bacterium]